MSSSSETLPSKIDTIPALSIPPFEATPVGLIVHSDHVPYEVWEAYGAGLQRVEGALQFVIGDWLNYGPSHYGEKYAQALTIWGEDAYVRLRQYAWIANKMQLYTRVYNLSWTYYREVATLEDTEEQFYWLALAERGDKPEDPDEHWSVARLRQEIQKASFQKRIQKAKETSEGAFDKRWSLEVADLATYSCDKQFDFIITDPPYPREYLGLYGVLAERAKEWLKPSGLLLAMCGQSYLPEIMAAMGKYLSYYWIGCYLTPGQPTPLRQRQVNTTWKPILIYALSDSQYKGKIFGDVWTSPGPDKEWHEWGQSVDGMLSIIQQVCLPGQSIFDPFCGAGTAGVAALKHGCFFRGIDIDETSIALARARLQEASIDPETL